MELTMFMELEVTVESVIVQRMLLQLCEDTHIWTQGELWIGWKCPVLPVKLWIIYQKWLICLKSIYVNKPFTTLTFLTQGSSSLTEMW